MEFRNIFIANPAQLRLKNRQLVIRQEQEIAVPLEDISTLMIESREVMVSTSALSSLAEAGVTVFFCDEKHLPVSQMLPMNQYCRQKKMLLAQTALSKPIQKQIWKKIVQQKIRNQAKCLELLGRDSAEILYDKAKDVLSGDAGNVEGVAAAVYFPKLFWTGFTRGENCVENAALNYGYAILRGAIARNLVIHGLEPCIGIHHHSELNCFNLADDLIEPYRPLIDLFVASYNFDNEEELTTTEKAQIVNLTNYLILQNGKRYKVMTAIGRSASALANCVREQKNEPELPELLALELHRYE